jgi:FkbM family methyltransferase
MLKENKSAFLAKKLEKLEYMGRMYEGHKILYEYADYIKTSKVADITIKDGEVYFTFLSNGLQIKMTCLPYDVTSVPFTFLDFGDYDQAETKFLFSLVRDGTVALDIGANLGWHTLHWLKKAKNVKVFAFEPLPETFHKLAANLALNGLPTSGAFNYGLADVNAERDFFFDTERCGASALVNLRGTDKAVNVPCRVKRLDDVFPTLGVDRLDLIKCDVEGAEKLVLEGGLETIKKYRPVIFAEMLRKWAKKYDYHPNDIIGLLAGLDYDCYMLNQGDLQRIERVTEETEETNYVFLDKKRQTESPRRLA